MNLCMSSSFHFSSFSLYLPRSCQQENASQASTCAVMVTEQNCLAHQLLL